MCQVFSTVSDICGLYMGPYKQNGTVLIISHISLAVTQLYSQSNQQSIGPIEQTLKNFDFKDKTQQPGRKDAIIKEMAKKLEMTITPDRVNTQ